MRSLFGFGTPAPRKTSRWLGIGVAIFVAGALAPTLFLSGEDPRAPDPGQSERAAYVQDAYRDWVAARDPREFQNPGAVIEVALSWSKGLSKEFSSSSGRATLDLASGEVEVEVDGLANADVSEVWLVDNQDGPGRSVQPEPGDEFLRVGTLEGALSPSPLGVGPQRQQGDGGKRRVRAALGGAFDDFEVDLVMVARRGQPPDAAGVLFGAPTLFQRLYASAWRAPNALAPAKRARWDRVTSASDVLREFLPASALAAGLPLDIQALVDDGETLFFTQVFGGNGRTCGTCHPAENNFVIDPDFIATRPRTDPLFVAEFNPALAQNFENPRLMRQLGLIQENLDGFGDLANKFVMRGVPHTLALRTSLTPAPNAADGTTKPPNQRTGWSGDGAPGGGTLREFAIGAVTQHFTRTLSRTPGKDFRLPTDAELNALEAFQLSLGRQADSSVPQIRLRGPLARRGREIFLAADSQGGTVAAGKCDVCHANAGATFSVIPGGFNFNFDTGVEGLPDQPANFIDPAGNRPDGGFGTAPHPQVPGAFGNGTFNTPPLIEAADTPPFFHNNSIQTLEEAIGFYNSAAFNNSPSGQLIQSLDSGGIGIQLEPTQVKAVAAFLRVLNALENVRSASVLLRASQRGGADAANDLRVAAADLDDAAEVLKAGGIHSETLAGLREAALVSRQAAATTIVPLRIGLIRRALQVSDTARRVLVD